MIGVLLVVGGDPAARLGKGRDKVLTVQALEIGGEEPTALGHVRRQIVQAAAQVVQRQVGEDRLGDGEIHRLAQEVEAEVGVDAKMAPRKLGALGLAQFCLLYTSRCV